MADTPKPVPPPPPGFTPIDSMGSSVSTPTAAPAPPPGFTPISSVGSDTNNGGAPPDNSTFMDKVGQFAKGVGEGWSDESLKTIAGTSALLHKIPGVGETLAPQEGIDAANKIAAGSGNGGAQGAGEKVGGLAENAGEFYIGDAAADAALARASNFIKWARQYPHIDRVLQIVDKVPWLQKMVLESGKGAAVGGAIGGEKGIATGQAGSGAKSGAELGAAAGSVSAALGEVNPFRKTTIAGQEFKATPFRTGANDIAGQQAIRNIGTDVSSTAGGLPVSQASSLRDAWQEPAEALKQNAKQYYAQLDAASNNAWTANQNALENVHREIRMKWGLDPQADTAMAQAKANLEAQQRAILAKVPAGTADAAENTWRQHMRAEDLQDVFQRKTNTLGVTPTRATPGVTPPESYNWKNIAKELNSWAPKDLDDAMGGDSKAAKDLLATVNQAAKEGWSQSKSAQKVGKILLGLGGLAAASAGAGEVYHLAH